ncbi:ABC-F family ATP-binding cassette domain-containing protein [Paradesertivirga mongoliensis]|uniref:ABC-F family ATP-binding cassette domain-containing protein n=1 Tax=Paradesertivirga mongoliensis TaxID=2100740 RepID=A0ABW4ZIJ6_9SPHI|nr:ABC-F family ATP-binding cassette domain-containing protein [Pedobacter mongoliensis]
MSILAGEQLGHAFNDYWLFKDLTFGVAKGQRVSLVGVNGSGKTTLLRILAEKLKPNEGKVVKEKGLHVGYLEQDPDFSGQKTVSDFIYSLDNKQQQLIRRYEELIENPDADATELESLIHDLSEANAWEYEHEIKTILQRLSITNLDQEIKSLSGGQRKRLALAKLLIDNPEVFILDEPTNHLDIEMIEWLESFLTTGQKTIIMVTHDRYFLDNVCNHIIELENRKIYTYNGNYGYFLEKKAEREASDASTLQKNRNLLKKELEWMRRMPKARSTKSKSRIDAFYELEDKTKGNTSNQVIELSTKVARQGNKILELEHVAKAYNGRTIIRDFNYTFKKGDRIGVAGKNGSGKSTFLNLITGTIQPDTGEISIGETTQFGYYKQSGLEFDESQRVIDIVKDVAEYITMADGKTLTASQLLTHFLFPPAKQHNVVSKLSGGEKKRLHLMRVLMKNPNFLILDEPTNDLDIDTLNVLEEFLERFTGVLLLVSHDRYLMDRLTEQLFILEGAGEVDVYSGNYTDYRLEKEEASKTASSIKPSVSADNVSVKKNKLSFKEEQELNKLEQELPALENELKSLLEELSNLTNHVKLIELSKKIEDLKAAIDVKTMRWLELNEEKENVPRGT